MNAPVTVSQLAGHLHGAKTLHLGIDAVVYKSFVALLPRLQHISINLVAMASTNSHAPLESTLYWLTVDSVCANPNVKQPISVSVLQVVANRVRQRVYNEPAAQTCLGRISAIVLEVLYSANAAELATDHCISIELVRNTVRYAASINSNALALMQMPSSHPLSALFIPAPANNSRWPASIPEHALCLRQAFDHVYNDMRTTGSGAMMNTFENLEVMREGMALLEWKIARGYGKVASELPVEARAKNAWEGWCRDGTSNTRGDDAGGSGAADTVSSLSRSGSDLASYAVRIRWLTE